MSEKRMLTGILVDPERNICGIRTIEDTLPNLYDLLDCDLIDITQRMVGDTPVSIICDDEGLLRDEPWASAATPTGHPALFGALFIVAPGADEEGNLLSLTEEARKSVTEHLRRGLIPYHWVWRTILFDVHYFAYEED